MATATSPATRNGNRQELITNSIDKSVAGNLTISRAGGGLVFKDMAEVMELAKLMALSQQAVPPHCRAQPGICLGLAIQAVEWRMSPYAVAGKSYVVNDRIGYESQMIHAVIEQRAPIKSRLRHRFIGEGQKRQCVVWATAKGEDEPLEYTSPEFGNITPKNSPLWKTKPDLQLFYNASRDWARMYFPDVIMGVYADDELLEAMPGSQAVDRPRGIAGLKQQLVTSDEVGGGESFDETSQLDENAEQSGEVDQSTSDDSDGIDEPGSNDLSEEEQAAAEKQWALNAANAKGKK